MFFLSPIYWPYPYSQLASAKLAICLKNSFKTLLLQCIRPREGLIGKIVFIIIYNLRVLKVKYRLNYKTSLNEQLLLQSKKQTERKR